jgi:hypothetical protein
MPKTRTVTNRAASLQLLFGSTPRSTERESWDAISRLNDMAQGKNLRTSQSFGDSIKAHGGNEGDACPRLSICSIEGLEPHL